MSSDPSPKLAASRGSERRPGTVPFVKMHGLGNDFVIIDARGGDAVPDQARIAALGNRKTGVGFDQLIVMEPGLPVSIRIFNQNGSEVSACGNATRCIADILMQESGLEAADVKTRAGLLRASRSESGHVSVDMGRPGLAWQDIPVARAIDTISADFSCDMLKDPALVSMGNPHAVFFVADIDAVPMTDLGPGIEHDPLFPEKVNVSAAQILGPADIRLRVWERGVGITEACGTAACAALVGANRRGLAGRSADIHLDGGVLHIEWRGDGHVIMTGPVATSFTGEVAL